MAPLVDYSDSDSDNEGSIFNRPSSKNPDVHGKSVKSKSASTLPPLPQKFQDLYMVSARSSVLDDPELHAGRQRSIPHVEGNWPTHIYLECMVLLN